MNHYAHRSEEDYRKKLARPEAHSGRLKGVPDHTVERRMQRQNEVRDDTIKAYLPALREALARPGNVTPSAAAGEPSSART